MNIDPPRHTTMHYLGKLLILGGVYFIIAQIGLSMHIGLAWSLSGVALAGLLIWNYEVWPALAAASFIVCFLNGLPLLVCLAIAFGNTIEAIVGTYFLRRFISLYRCFERLPDTLRFIYIVVVATPLIGAVIGTAALVFGGVETTGFFTILCDWWLGSALSVLIVTPFLMVWLAATRPWKPKNGRPTEVLWLFCGSLLVDSIVFWFGFGNNQNIPLLYLSSFPLIWSVLRLGARAVTASLLMTALFVTIGTTYGHGPFAAMPLEQGILFTQIFLITTGITFLIFLSIFKERENAMEEAADYVEKLRQSFREVKSADQAKTEFLAMLSHELRNPLAAVMSSLEVLSTHNPLGETYASAHTMSTHIKHMSRLLDDLLDMSIIARDKFTLQKEMVDLRSVITYSIEEVMPLIRLKGHVISVSMPEEPVYVYGDHVRLEQVLVNICNNSAKYTDAGGSIALSVSQEGDQAIVRLVDNGIGIDPSRIATIFEPFVQLESNTARFGKGLGIGLSLSKKLIEAHGGTITAISSGKNKGSEFIVALPLMKMMFQKQKEIKELEKSEIPKNTSEKKKYTILIVDDNQTAANGLNTLLTHGGHQATVSYDGESALLLAAEIKPQVIILDIGLPDTDGYQVARHIRRTHNPSPILVALTGYGQNDDKLKATEAGFNYHLTKPVSIVDIEAVLAQIGE